MSGWYMFYMALCVINTMLLHICGVDFRDPIWWALILVHAFTYVAGRNHEKSINRAEEN